MQFNIKRRVYEHVLTASECLHQYVSFRKIIIKQLWYFTSDNLNLMALTLSKSLKKEEKEVKK